MSFKSVLAGVIISFIAVSSFTMTPEITLAKNTQVQGETLRFHTFVGTYGESLEATIEDAYSKAQAYVTKNNLKSVKFSSQSFSADLRGDSFNHGNVFLLTISW